jgi:hypothetical protein
VTAAEDLAEWRSSQFDAGRHVGVAEEIAWLCEHVDALTEKDPVLAVRNFSKGVRTLAGVIHLQHSTTGPVMVSHVDSAHEVESCS